MSRHLIVTADDFGMSLEVNEAVEEAHRNGVLTCASLVVAGAAANDAIRRAKRMPKLGVGLHLALFGAPAQAPGTPSRVAPDGANLGEQPVRTGTAIMLLPHVRNAARREIDAQFKAYRRSGLALGHLDGHWHCHQHPAVLAMALAAGKEQGLRAIRIPYEGFGWSKQITGRLQGFARVGHAIGHAPLAAYMRFRARAAGLRANDWFFAMTGAGSVSAEQLRRLVAQLPPGITEVGLHPAARQWSGPHAPPAIWDPVGELAALTDPELRADIVRRGIALCRWAELP